MREDEAGYPARDEEFQGGESVRRAVRKKIMAALEDRGQMEDDQLCEIIDGLVLQEGRDHFLPLKEQISMRAELFDSFRRLGILQELVDDREVTEIMVNGQDHIFIERKGSVQLWKKTFESREQLEDMIQQIVSRVNRVVNVSRPIADARLEDGSRVHVVLPPVALDGPVLTIRKFPKPITMESLIRMESISRQAAEFLKCLVTAGYNIFISGGTNSGKSTFLNALSAFIPREQRLITIEDSAELQIRHIKNLVRLETRGANTEGEGELTIADLIRASLRMNPDRILVGEVRGKEALDMIQAMNTGHDGSLSTGHANSPADMLSRLETMVLMGMELPLAAVRGQIASAIDILVHLGRLRDRSRRVLEITEIGGFENGEIRLNPLFQFEEEGENRDCAAGGPVCGSLKKRGELKNVRKLKAAGLTV